jgi:hypothetical protein
MLQKESLSIWSKREKQLTSYNSAILRPVAIFQCMNPNADGNLLEDRAVSLRV